MSDHALILIWFVPLFLVFGLGVTCFLSWLRGDWPHKKSPDSGDLRPFAIEYRHNGKLYHIDVYATDFDDALARIRSAHYNGVPLKRVISI